MAQVMAIETLYKAVTLHELVVEVGQGFRLFGIHDDAQPETEAGNVDGSLLYIYSVDIVLDNLSFEGSTGVGV